LLYDPARSDEGHMARAVREHCVERGVSVRMNYPYRGTADGFTTHCRKRFPARRYLGLEIELNQRIVRSRRTVTAVLDAIVGVLEG
ncbi:MAG: N-formylglutamate amidohydrolase, partial [Gemmatimonadota bacterium]|nr:N-formylglutamate amidohydrolase [Gemmatimonadota bacterium]